GYSLNFVEPMGPLMSLSLWLAECYCLATVLLMFVQTGLGGPPPSRPLPRGPFHPSVDVMIPIYSEPCDILEKTLIAAVAMRYPNKRIYICDDSHRLEVQKLAERYGATYLLGPRRHAKAGNLNNALTQSRGELIVIFDTDHIPVASFLEETVPYFVDPKLG